MKRAAQDLNSAPADDVYAPPRPEPAAASKPSRWWLIPPVAGVFGTRSTILTPHPGPLPVRGEGDRPTVAGDANVREWPARSPSPLNGERGENDPARSAMASHPLNTTKCPTPHAKIARDVLTAPFPAPKPSGAVRRPHSTVSAENHPLNVPKRVGPGPDQGSKGGVSVKFLSLFWKETLHVSRFFGGRVAKLPTKTQIVILESLPKPMAHHLRIGKAHETKITGSTRWKQRAQGQNPRATALQQGSFRPRATVSLPRPSELLLLPEHSHPLRDVWVPIQQHTPNATDWQQLQKSIR